MQLEKAREAYIKTVGISDEWYSNCKIPKRYYGKRLDNFNGFRDEVSVAVKAISSGESVFLTGNCGTGKTHLAIALSMEWIRQRIVFTEIVHGKFYPLINGDTSNPHPYFLPSVELFLRLKSTFGDKNVSEDDVINDMMRFPLLIIDDVGAEKVSDWSRQMFYTLIDRCYRMMKPVIITTNMDLSKIAETFDDRIASRIVGMGAVITLIGEDHRMKNE